MTFCYHQVWKGWNNKIYKWNDAVTVVVVSYNIYDTCVLYSGQVPDAAWFISTLLVFSPLSHCHYWFAFHVNTNEPFTLAKSQVWIKSSSMKRSQEKKCNRVSRPLVFRRNNVFFNLAPCFTVSLSEFSIYPENIREWVLLKS